MTQANTTPEQAQFDANTGFCNVAGWITIYHSDPHTREYLGASDEYVPLGMAPPAHVYLDAPELPPNGQAIRRSADGTQWEQVADHRGTQVYRIADRTTVTLSELGEIPPEFTLLAPASEFDQWQEDKWVKDLAAEQAAALAQLDAEKAQKLAEAQAIIAPLQEAVDLEMASDAEQAQLTAWRKYRVLLNRVDITTDTVEWPTHPEQMLRDAELNASNRSGWNTLKKLLGTKE